jgi:hypothetical protein
VQAVLHPIRVIHSHLGTDKDLQEEGLHQPLRSQQAHKVDYRNKDLSLETFSKPLHPCPNTPLQLLTLLSSNSNSNCSNSSCPRVRPTKSRALRNLICSKQMIPSHSTSRSDPRYSNIIISKLKNLNRLSKISLLSPSLILELLISP